MGTKIYLKNYFFLLASACVSNSFAFDFFSSFLGISTSSHDFSLGMNVFFVELYSFYSRSFYFAFISGCLADTFFFFFGNRGSVYNVIFALRKPLSGMIAAALGKIFFLIRQRYFLRKIFFFFFCFLITFLSGVVSELLISPFGLWLYFGYDFQILFFLHLLRFPLLLVIKIILFFQVGKRLFLSNGLE